MIFLGIICIPCSLLLGPLFILAAIGGVIIILAGIGAIQGQQAVTCPYCSKTTNMSFKADAFKCPACKKRSVRNGDYLNPVN